MTAVGTTHAHGGPPAQPQPQGYQKGWAAGLAGAIAGVAAWGYAEATGRDMPPAVVIALTTILSVVLVVLVPNRPRGL